MQNTFTVQNFLFSSIESKPPRTVRSLHIKRLYDALQLCLHRDDIPRAKRAWTILTRCKEFHWKTMWTMALHILQRENQIDSEERSIEFLRDMMIQYPAQQQSIFLELIFQLVLAGQEKDAMDDLELYLPTYPYQDNPLVHIYAGLLSLFLAQPQGNNIYKPNMLRNAQTYFEHALLLDPNNNFTLAFINKITSLHQQPEQEFVDSDEDDPMSGDYVTTPSRKRAKKT